MVKIAKTEYEDLLSVKASFDEIRSFFIQSSQNPPTKIIGWDTVPTEDISVYKPGFVRKLKKSLGEVADGKGRVISSASEL